MTNPTGRRRPPSILRAEPTGPWGNGPDDEPGKGAGPRNPWAVPPGSRRSGPARPTALDEFLKRARGGGFGGGGGSGGGFGGMPPANARVLWGIGAALIALLWLVFTSVHAIGPQQQGVVTRLGAYAGTLPPGISITLPAPLVAVRKVDTRIQTDDFPKDGGENLMLTGDRSIVDLAYSVRWDVADARDFTFQLADPRQTVRDAAESAMRAVLATTSFAQATGDGRTEVAQRVADLTQTILTGYHAGVHVQGVSIRQALPPSRLADDFNKVTVAQQQRVADVSSAQSYANQVVARAEGEAAQFNKMYEQYRLAPEVTRRRMYYETMEAVLARSDKTVVATPGVVPYLPLKGATALPSPPAGTGAAR